MQECYQLVFWWQLFFLRTEQAYSRLIRAWPMRIIILACVAWCYISYITVHWIVGMNTISPYIMSFIENPFYVDPMVKSRNTGIYWQEATQSDMIYYISHCGILPHRVFMSRSVIKNHRKHKTIFSPFTTAVHVHYHPVQTCHANWA